MSDVGYSFRRWATPVGVSPSALFTEELTSGIYVLEFADAEEYVGKSVNFPTRFASHRRRWDDIVAVRFAAVLPAQLDDAERAVIGQRVKDGVRLRNLTLLSQPLGSSAFDLVVDREIQSAWLSATVDDDDVVIDEHRASLAQRRILSRSRLDLLRQHPLFNDVLESVAVYVALVIPWPDLTEGRLWTLTALPNTARRLDNRRLATLSIQNVEMLFLGEARGDDGQWESYTVLNTAVATDLPDSIAQLPRVHDGYRSTGAVHQFDLVGSNVTWDMLEVPEVRRAARSLALGQLRKGRGAFTRHHNDAFTDEVFVKIDELMGSDAPQ